MSERPTRKWTGLAGEGAIIVASILIAFALDAWWDDRQASQGLREELAAVVSEIDENLVSLDLEARLHRDAISSIDEFVRLIDEAGTQTISVPDSILNRAVYFAPSYDPSTGALEAFVAGGWLSRVPDPELRRQLSALPSRFQDLREEEEQARVVAHEGLLPLLLDQDALRSAMYSVAIYYDSTASPGAPLEQSGDPSASGGHHAPSVTSRLAGRSGQRDRGAPRGPGGDPRIEPPERAVAGGSPPEKGGRLSRSVRRSGPKASAPGPHRSDSS